MGNKKANFPTLGAVFTRRKPPYNDGIECNRISTCDKVSKAIYSFDTYGRHEVTLLTEDGFIDVSTNKRNWDFNLWKHKEINRRKSFVNEDGRNLWQRRMKASL